MINISIFLISQNGPRFKKVGHIDVEKTVLKSFSKIIKIS